jgi:linoleoyl-CoA desaturase
MTNLMLTTASFSTSSPVMPWLTGGMTHHLAHHLRPTAPRAELPALHRTIVPEVVAEFGLPLVEYPTVQAAVKGHWQRLRELGQPDIVPAAASERVSATALSV